MNKKYEEIKKELVVGETINNHETELIVLYVKNNGDSYDALMLRKSDNTMVIGHGLRYYKITDEEGNVEYSWTWGNGDYCGDYFKYIYEQLEARDRWTRSKQYETEERMDKTLAECTSKQMQKSLNNILTDEYLRNDGATEVIFSEYKDGDYETKEAIENVFKAITDYSLEDFAKNCIWDKDDEESEE